MPEYKRYLPIGRVWDAMRAEKNWCVAAITVYGNKVPVSAVTGIPADRTKAAIFAFEAAAKCVNDLKKRVDAVNQRVKSINTKRPTEIQFEEILSFEVGYLAREGSAVVVGDFDKVRDPQTGEITADWMKPLLDDPDIRAPRERMHFLRIFS